MQITRKRDEWVEYMCMQSNKKLEKFNELYERLVNN